MQDQYLDEESCEDDIYDSISDVSSISVDDFFASEADEESMVDEYDAPVKLCSLRL